MPRAKDDQKISQIHDAARRLVIHTGFSGMKMADVAKEAGMATGTLYIYYDSKEALINDLYFSTKKEITMVLLDPKNQALTFFETFRNMWVSYFRFNLQNPEKMLFTEQFKHSGLITAENLARTDAALKPLDDFLENAKQQALVKNIDTDIIKAHLDGSIYEIVKTITKNSRHIDTATAEAVFEMAWDGIKK
jgi:TetR/AcrR family transcriptional regulator, repressor of fatR-cypB operon